MYHSVTFGNKNTWDDWFLIPSSRPVFNPPEVKTNYLEIPGSDGVLDLTAALTGSPNYSNRIGSFEFIVDNGHKEWFEIYSEISNYLHGQVMKAILEDSPDYYYEGRFSVKEWKSDPTHSLITIDYNVDTYKRKTALTVVSQTGNGVVNLSNLKMPVTPRITTTAETNLTWLGNTVSLNSGANQLVPALTLDAGVVPITVVTSGKVTFTYREGGF